MRPYPLTVLAGGINRLRVKGGAAANMLYDLQNAYITNAGSIVPREGTVRTATLSSNTVGLMAANGNFNIFSSQYSTAALPANYVLNVLSDPNNPGVAPATIWFAKPFMGFPYVVAEFNGGDIVHYWLQNNGTWTSSTDYTSASIVLPPVPNGLAYQGVRNFPIQPLWTADTVIASASYVEPNTPTGFCYQAIAVAGTPSHTGAIEPVWPTVAGGTIQEFGDFDASSTDAGTTQGASVYSTAASLDSTLTDRYGDSGTVSNSGIFATSSTLSTLTLASTKVTTWKAGTTYPPGAVVVPTTNQGAFINAIPNGDFEGGAGAGGWTFTDSGGTDNWAFDSTLPLQGTEDIAISNSGSFGADGAYATMTSYSLVTPGQNVITTAHLNPNNNGSNLELWLQINWYDNTDAMLSFTRSPPQSGGGYRLVTVSGIAPANAAHARVAIRAGSGTGSRNAGYADLVSWNLATPAPVTNFLFEAVQAAPGISAATEPNWPTVLGNEVIDGTVTWQAIGTSIITWQAIPLMQSGLTAPTFPTVIGNEVFDFSTYSNKNGYVTTFCGMLWECVDRHVLDTNCPQQIPVALGASHVFNGDNDICNYSAAVNPIDWTSTNNAGYLPTGLNNYGDNPIAMLALYRSNLMVFNAGGYQMWQIDPDPQNMALLDAQPVGSIWPRAAQSVANDLLFLTEVGVRNLGTVGPTANMAVGNTGQPVDPLITAQFTQPGTIADPYFSSVSLLLGMTSAAGSTTFVDSSNNEVITTSDGGLAIANFDPIFPGQANGYAAFTSGTQFLAMSNTTGSPLDLSNTDFTIEFWAKSNIVATQSYVIFADAQDPPQYEIFFDVGAPGIHGVVTSTIQTGSISTFTGSFPSGDGIWHAVAFVKTSTAVTTYLDGVAGRPGLLTTSTLIAPSGNAHMGYTLGLSFAMQGLEIADFRVTKVARYTDATYAVPTAPFPSSTYYYQPLSIYYPGRGQYWLFFGNQAFVLTINGTAGTKSWSRYLFPQAITDATVNEGYLYLRTTGSLVWQVNPAATAGIDDQNTITTAATPTPFNGVVQWPYLDMGALGINKMLVGVDIVGEGNCSIQVAYNQTDKSTFCDNANFATSTGVTTPYFIAVDDTVPGEPLPIPINAPSYSLILTFTGSTSSPNAWSWEAANLYIQPQGGAGATG